MSVILTACGGGGGSENASGESLPSETQQKYPEPSQDVADETSIGFYDYDVNDEIRVIRNDLEGSFNAQVQFGQSHVVDPNGNEAKKMPRLTTEKDA